MHVGKYHMKWTASSHDRESIWGQYLNFSETHHWQEALTFDYPFSANFTIHKYKLIIYIQLVVHLLICIPLN